MNTRKNRKRTWKVQEAQETQEDEEVVAEQPTKETASTAAVAAAKKVEVMQQQDSNRLLLFLQSWQEAKEAQVNGTLRKDMPESIADLMFKKGYPISVNVARTKIMNFIKKYNLVKKMAAQGKPNEWSHYHTVKKILEFGPPILPSANVAIPIENIKSEEKASLKENTLKIAERKVSTDAQKAGSSVKEKKGIDLIEIPDDDPQLLKPRVYFSESEPVEESDDSDMSDEDLDFENPLDKISFGFNLENGAKPKPTSTVLPPKMIKFNKNFKSLMPGLNKLENNDKTTKIPTQKPLAQPILPKQHIIPLPKNMKLPQTTNNGAPQQYLIVRPLTPGNPKKTLAIPMGNQFKMAPGKQEAIHAQMIKTPLNSDNKGSVVNNQIKMLNIPKIPAQITMSSPPPLVSAVTGATTTTNEQSPCSSPGSTNTPTVRQLLTNVIQLETNIYNLQQERLQLERERFEMERDYGKEMINIFRDIKDKICDFVSVPKTEVISNQGDGEQQN